MRSLSSAIRLIICTILFLCFPALCLSQGYPQRIISLGPQLTEELYLLGAGGRLIANTIYCRFPPDAAKKEKVGTITEVNIEKVVRLRPDLVLATPLSDPRAKEKLKSLGIRVVDFPLAKSFGDICRYFIELGKIIGQERKAEGIVKTAKAGVDSLMSRVNRFARPKVFMQVGSRPLFTITRDSFVNDFIGLAGGVNIASDAGSGIYSREKVIEQNPDIIIIMAMGNSGEKEKEDWQKYRTLNAVKNNRVYIIDDYKLGSPTPVNFVNTLEEIAGMLHPEYRPVMKAR